MKVLEAIDKQPTVKEDQKYGHWESHEWTTSSGRAVLRGWKCSSCSDRSVKNSNYCSNCGCKMTNVEEEVL